MKLTYRDGTYRCLSTYEERSIPKSAGFLWDPGTRTWWTSDTTRAEKLREYADEAAAEQLDAARAARELSRAVDAEIDVPAPEGLSYLPYQRAGIAYARERTRSLIADEMGLGKTIQAIGLINLTNPTSVMIVCPNSVKLNWRRELERWLVEKRPIGIANGKSFPDDDIVIINYDIVGKHRGAIDARTWDLLIVDEAHYLKNSRAQRTQYVLGRWDYDERERIQPINARQTVFLSGTPLTNRPIELWPILKYSLPNTLGRSWKYYVTRYCGGEPTRYGWYVDGATNLDELQERLRSELMVRRRKADVLAELPAKRRQVVELPANGCEDVVRREQEAMDSIRQRLSELRRQVEAARGQSESAYRAAVKQLREGTRAAFGEIARLRHDTAVAKVPSVVAYALDCLESVDKLVIFAHHHDVIEGLSDGLREAKVGHVTLTGEHTVEERQAAIDRFQTNPSCRVFVGSITAAGLGITLTAASHVLFAELDWVPANIIQAEDRCHRIGQRDSVLVQHLVLEGSIDVTMARALIDKQAVLDAVLDGDGNKDVEDDEEAFALSALLPEA